MVDMAVGIEDNLRLQPPPADHRKNELGLSAGINDGAFPRLRTVDEIAVCLQGADDDNIVDELHLGPYLKCILANSQSVDLLTV
jgi:hypothetical protein